MSVAFRIRAWPRAAATGAAVAIFLAGGNNGAPHHDGTNHYQAGIVADPRFEAMVSFTDEGWGAKAVPLAGAIGWSPSDPAKLDPIAALYWKDAAIEIDRIKDGVTTRRLTGAVAEATVVDGKLVITCADLSQKLDKPFTTATFAGTGGIEGGASATGRTKRRNFGLVWNVEGRLLDKVNNIYEFGDPAFPLQGCTALRDMGRAGPLGIIAWQGSIAATLNALKAATPQRGGGLFAPSIACAKWWTQPAGPLTADLQGEASGYSQTPAGVAAQLLAAAGGPAISDAGPARTTPVGLHIGDNSETTSGALDRLLQRIAMGWRLSSVGTVELWDYRFTAPVETLRAIFISRESTIQPVKARTVGYKKNERVHGEGEISAAVQASDVVYADGTTGEDMKPAEAGATKGATAGVNIFIPEIPGIPAPPGLIRNDMLELDADGVLSYQPYPDNADIKVALGQVAVPDIAGQLELQPDGSLRFVTPDGDVQTIGRIRLPDMGAASEASRRTLENAVDQLGAAVARVVSEASLTRENFRDAGFYVDPDTGQIRLSAIDQTRERISTAEFRLSAAEASITLRATTSYVDGRIAQLVLDPSQFPVYEGIELRVSDVEVRLSGAEASIAQKATLIDLNLLGGRVSNAEQTIDALAGQIVLKVDRTEFDAVEARVSSAEQTIEALGDSASIVQALSAVRMLPAEAASAQENALRALLSGDHVARSQVAAIASARTELTAQITGGLGAEARARTELAVRIGRAEASALTETQARVERDRAITLMVTQLTSQFADSSATFSAQIATLATDTQALAARSEALEVEVAENAAAIATERAARIDEDGAIRASASEAISAARGLNARVDAVLDIVSADLLRGDARARELAGSIAGAREEITAKVNGEVEAIVSRVSILLARLGQAEAAIVLEEIARATQNEAIVSQLQALSATVGEANATFTQQIGALANDALAATLRMDAMESAIGDNAAAIDSEASTRAQADGRIEAAAGQTVAAVRNVDGSAAKAAEQALRALLAGDAGQRDAIGAVAAARQEVTAKINSDVEALVQRITVLLARLGLAEASIVEEQFARVTAQAALAAQIVTLGARIDDANATITSDRAARVDGEAILAARIDTTEAANEDTAAAVRTEEQARIDGDGALASQFTSLKAEKDGDVADLTAQVQAANQARIDGNLAQAASTEALRAEKNDDVSDIRAQATLDRQATIDGDEVVAASVDALRVEKNADVGALSAELSKERQARLDDKGAIVADVEELRATVGETTAELTEQRAVLVDLEGRTAISFRIAATDPDGTTYIEITRQAGTGRILLGGDVITPGSITAKEIEANGITRTFSAANSAAAVLSTEMTDIVTFTVVMARPGTIMVNAVHQLVFATGGAWATELNVEGATLMSETGNIDHKSVLIGSFSAASAGNYTVHLRARRTAGAVSINAGGSVMLVHRTYA